MKRRHGVLAVFHGQPWPVTAALAVIVLAAGVLMSWNIGSAGYSPFYSTAARSMSMSWRAFAFGAFDPGATITLDKLSGFLVPQALAARIFGYHAWSMALPQVIEGMITVVAVFAIGTRWKGAAAGIIAASALATTPLLVSMFGRVMEDGLLTMSLALAFACWQSSILGGRVGPLLWSGFWVAIGFQAKMMQAWFILPALAISYILVGEVTLLSRIRRAVLLGVVAIALSLTWMTAIQFVPAADRPYIDGSTNNNVFSMVFGYNGFNRIVPNLIPGAVGDAHLRSFAGPFKLLLPEVTTQVGWLYPLALGGMLTGLHQVLVRRHRNRVSKDAVTSVAMSIWLATAVALISIGQVPHTAYFAALSVQIALLSAGALVDGIALLESPSRLARAVLPGLLAVETSWVLVLLAESGSAAPSLIVSVALLGFLSAAFLAKILVRRAGQPSVPLVRGLVTAGVLGVLLAPTVWSSSTVDHAYAGLPTDAYAGPRIGEAAWLVSAPSSEPAAVRRHIFAVGAPYAISNDPGLSGAQKSLVAYIRSQIGNRSPLVATETWRSAAPYILKGGLDVMPIGGFSGSVPSPTVTQFAQRVASGTVEFALLGDIPRFEVVPLRVIVPTRTAAVRVGLQNNAAGGAGRTAVVNWIVNACTVVPADVYESDRQSLPGQILYRCGNGPVG
jgi:4-amino-4-deoxy-L-arabinose transferase-like glycosyltransferase